MIRSSTGWKPMPPLNRTHGRAADTTVGGVGGAVTMLVFPVFDADVSAMKFLP